MLDYLIKSQIRNTKYFGDCLEQCENKKSTFWGKPGTNVDTNWQARIFYKTIMQYMNPLNRISLIKFVNELNDTKTLTDINNNYTALNETFHRYYAETNKPPSFTTQTQKQRYNRSRHFTFDQMIIRNSLSLSIRK